MPDLESPAASAVESPEDFVRLVFADDGIPEYEVEHSNLGRNLVDGIRSRVHQIEFRQHGQCATSIGIHVLGQFQTLRCRHVRVGRRHCEDDGIWVLDELDQEVLDLCLNIIRLVSHWHLCDARQIDQGEIDHPI